MSFFVVFVGLVLSPVILFAACWFAGYGAWRCGANGGYIVPRLLGGLVLASAVGGGAYVVGTAVVVDWYRLAWLIVPVVMLLAFYFGGADASMRRGGRGGLLSDRG